MPDAKVYDVIVRVSRVGYRSATLDSDKDQEARCRAYIGSVLGGTVGKVHVEKDVSGKTTNRKALREAKERALSGQCDGLVAAYVSRFSRNTLEGLELVHDLLNAGREFVALDCAMDLRSAQGEQFLTMLLAQARAEWRQRQDTFNHYRAKAVNRGVHLTECFGYRRGPDGRLEPDPTEGPWVGRIFEKRAAGASLPELAAWLNEMGIKPHDFGTRKDGQKSARKAPTIWRRATIGKLLENRTYLGEARSGDNRNAVAHEPLVSAELFARVNAQRSLRPRRGKAEYELSGILRCGHPECGGRMKGSSYTRVMKKTGEPKTFRYYLCAHANDDGPRCPSGAKRVVADVAEAFARDQLAAIVEGIGARISERTDTLEAALAHVAELEALRDQAAADLDLRTISRAAYVAAIAEAEDRISKAKAIVRDARAKVTGVAVKPEDVAEWSALPVDVRRRFLAEAFEAIFVSPDRAAFGVIGRGEAIDLAGVDFVHVG